MLLNTASQSIGAQMVTAADGTAFTGAVTVAVTIDSGTQATGTVGSGACTHEGNGYHSYRPSQAETNGAHIAYTFTGTGAIPATVQVFTVAGDAFTRLGAPAGASVSADIAAVKVDTAAILVDTGTTLDGRIPAALVSGRMDCSVGAMAANTLTASALAADAVTEIQSGLATAAALDTVDNFLDTEIAAILAAVDTEIGTLQTTATAIEADTQDIQTRLPAALVSGRMDSNMQAAADGVITAAVVATGAIDADALAADAGTEIAAAVLTAAASNPIDANIQEINDVAITGNGQAGTEFSV